MQKTGAEGAKCGNTSISQAKGQRKGKEILCTFCVRLFKTILFFGTILCRKEIVICGN